LETFGSFSSASTIFNKILVFLLLLYIKGGITMEIIKPLKERIISIPNIEIGNEIKHFFSVFLIQSIVFLLFTPIAISVPAYLLLHSFSISSTFMAFGIFTVGTIVFITWLFVSILFFYSVTDPKTWPRYVALSWLAILIGTFITWIFFFNTLL
jgi:hypothetical protein